MKLFRSYFSVILFALLVLPGAEKALHDFSHFDEEYCVVKDTHFCQAEHHCQECDYLSAKSFRPAETRWHAYLLVSTPYIYSSAPVSRAFSNASPVVSLRGPPDA